MARRFTWLRVVFRVRDDPLKEGQIVQKVKEAWKAVVAAAIPALLGAAVSINQALADWVSQQSGIWVGVVLGLITAAGVWLKRNAQSV